MKLSEIAKVIGARIKGDPEIEIAAPGEIESAIEGNITFLGDRKYLRALLNSKASAVIIDEKLENSNFAAPHNLLLVKDANSAFDKVVELFAPPRIEFPKGISERAFVSPNAIVAESASIGPMCVIEDGAKVGENSVLVAGVYVGKDSELGSECMVYANVVIRERCKVGDRVTLHPCVVIGADGFGFRTVGGVHQKIPQRGVVVVGNDVEIGACTCIDRARFSQTIIGDGTKLDNLVQIGHNVKVGNGALLAAQVGIAGTTTIGDYVMMGGQSGAGDHCKIGDRVIAMARTGVSKDIPPGTIIGGYPACEYSEYTRKEVSLRRMPSLIEKIRQFEERLAKLENTNEND